MIVLFQWWGFLFECTRQVEKIIDFKLGGGFMVESWILLSQGYTFPVFFKSIGKNFGANHTGTLINIIIKIN